MKRTIASILIGAALAATIAGPAAAGQPVQTQIWLDGELVRTVLPPAATPREGTDPFFMVPGTGGVAAVGPGDRGYHGGHWAVYVVSWNVAQYPLTSLEAIQAAEDAGDITITRDATADFLCPIEGN